MSTFDSYFADIHAEGANLDITLLLGLEPMTKLKLILHFDIDCVSSNADRWTVLVIRKLGHAYILWNSSVLYTEADLKRFHRHLCHPQTDKLFAVMHRAGPTIVIPNVYSELKKIRKDVTHDNARKTSHDDFEFPCRPQTTSLIVLSRLSLCI